MSWQTVKEGLVRWQPREDMVYECERVNYRSMRYFARLNGATMRTAHGTVYRDKLEQCKAKCERHYTVNTTGGEVP